MGVSGPQTEVPVVTGQAAIGFDLEHPAKDELEQAFRSGS
jgi:hypothetical protein